MTDSSQGHAGSGVNDSASDPPGVPVTPLLQWKPFADWSEYIKVDEVQTAPVATAGDVVSVTVAGFRRRGLSGSGQTDIH